jgi:hypothetical protein
MGEAFGHVGLPLRPIEWIVELAAGQLAWLEAGASSIAYKTQHVYVIEYAPTSAMSFPFRLGE